MLGDFNGAARRCEVDFIQSGARKSNVKIIGFVEGTKKKYFYIRNECLERPWFDAGERQNRTRHSLFVVLTSP